LVEKKLCLVDKRLVDVRITKKGLTMLDRLEVHNHQLDNILKNLSSEEALLLNRLLDKIREPNQE
ncbi:hypothetical protein ABTJ52_20985, partial [Acinetobacter baumannii]